MLLATISCHVEEKDAHHIHWGSPYLDVVGLLCSNQVLSRVVAARTHTWLNLFFFESFLS